MSLLNTVTSLMSNGLVDKVASMVGINSGIARTALSAIMPRILRGIASKGSTESGASSLLNMIKNHGLGANLDLNENMMQVGGKMNESIFGSSLSDVNIPGVSGDAKSKLVNLATPLAMGSVGKIVKEKNLDAKGLSSYLRDNVEEVKMTATESSPARAATNSGGGFMKWLIPLVLLLGAGWFFMQGKEDGAAAKKMAQPSTETTTMSKPATHTHADGTVHEGHSHGSSTTTSDIAAAAQGAAGTVAGAAGDAMDKGKEMMKNALSLDADGNLMKDGKLYLKSGEFTVKDGEYFDKEGKSLGLLGKVSKAIGDAGKAVGNAGKAVGGAVGGAAEKTADFFKDTFGGMFKKKSSGETVAAYSLSKIAFDPNSHKITSMSKNEVQGLAAALKAYPDAKITVQATGGDKKLSKMKAQVIHDMLVTLGVSDKQISAKGMGDGAEKFEIVLD